MRDYPKLCNRNANGTAVAFTDAMYADALERSGGMNKPAARFLGCTSKAVRKYRERIRVRPQAVAKTTGKTARMHENRGKHLGSGSGPRVFYSDDMLKDALDRAHGNALAASRDLRCSVSVVYGYKKRLAAGVAQVSTLTHPLQLTESEFNFVRRFGAIGDRDRLSL